MDGINDVYKWMSFFNSSQRYHCFLKNLEKTKQKKRSYIPAIDGSKEKLRKYYSETIGESISYVNKLYYDRYKRHLGQLWLLQTSLLLHQSLTIWCSLLEWRIQTQKFACIIGWQSLISHVDNCVNHYILSFGAILCSIPV